MSSVRRSVTRLPSIIVTGTSRAEARRVASVPPPCTIILSPDTLLKSARNLLRICGLSTTLPPILKIFRVCIICQYINSKKLFKFKQFLKGFKHAFENYLRRNLAVGCLGNHQTAFGFYDCIGDNHVASDGKAVHEKGVVGEAHLLFIHHP